MKLLVRLLLLISAVGSSFLPLHAQPPSGSQLSPEENGCSLCHGEAKLWKDSQQRLYVPHEAFAEDVHARNGVNCHDCHGGDPATLDITQAHCTKVLEGSKVLAFRTTPQETRTTCAVCHHAQDLQLRKSVHAHVERDDPDAPGRQLGCGKCHGMKSHGMLPVQDSRSPVFLNHQVQLCGGCHENDLATYKTTVHGKGLFKSGLLITAVCADCHGAHGTYYAADMQSTLNTANIAETCGKCHKGIGERVRKSVHGRGKGPGQATANAVPGQKWKRNPSCTDCHQGHRLSKPESSLYRAEIANQCGNCHPKLTSRYEMNTHGKLTELGYTAAAQCSDCHGAHDILPLDDPNCSLAPGENRLATCKQCHLHAVKNFSQFDPHANHKDAKQYPTLHFLYSFTQDLFLAFFLFFAIHAFLWFLRSFVSVLHRGRHHTLVAGQHVLIRFSRGNRVLYMTLLISFLGLTITGLPMKHSSQPWAQTFVRGLGGFESTSVWHIFFGTVGVLCCVLHVVGRFRSIRSRHRQGLKWREIFFGPDSPVPNLRDGKDLLRMLGWFFGIGPKPKFERWTYWEKYDYWMACIACFLVGGSGLVMWYPNLFCRFFSGESLNVARVFHVELAMLATSFLFIFHFFNTHFRPEKFPMDLSTITGLVDEEHLRRHRPEYVARLEETHQIDAMRRPAPSRRRLWLAFLGAALSFSIGLFLLGVALTAALGK